MRQMGRECADFLRTATPEEAAEKIRDGLKELFLSLPLYGGIDPMG
jgi:hypothetical protein